LSEQGKVDFWRAPQKYGKKTEDAIDQAAFDAYTKAADVALKRAIAGEQLNITSARPHHQFTKLALVDQTARQKLGTGQGQGKAQDWIHYVLWPLADAAPRTYGLNVVRTYLANSKEKSKTAMQAKHADLGEHKAFARLLLQGSEANADGWLQANEEQAVELIGALTELSPNWIIVDKGSGGLAKKVNAKAGASADAQDKQGGQFVESHRALSDLPVLSADHKPVEDLGHRLKH